MPSTAPAPVAAAPAEEAAAEVRNRHRYTRCVIHLFAGETKGEDHL